MSSEGYAGCLASVRAALDAEPDELRLSILDLVSADWSERLRALGWVPALARDHAALPYLFALAAAKGYPQSSAILLRLSAALSRVDFPPRARPTEASSAFVDAYARHAPTLLRIARTSTDPEAARAAARILGHLPEYDSDLVPLLMALLSGAADAVERAPLLYILARSQLSLGVALHPRIRRARDAEDRDPERIAVALALTDAGVDDADARSTLRDLRRVAHLPDPRAWGTTLDLHSP